MSWQTEMTPLVRALVNDVQSATYSDADIESTIVVASELLKFDVDFETPYAVSVEEGTITPDPTAVPAGLLPFGDTRDDAFIKLASLRAAMVILQQQQLEAALSAVRLVDGPSTLDYTAVVRAVERALENVAAQFHDAREQYMAGARTGFGLTSARTSWR